MNPEFAQVYELADRSSQFFAALARARSKYELDVIGTLIFLALGRVNFGNGRRNSRNTLFIEASNVASLSSFLDLPRETVRRKLIHLSERNLVQKSNTGFVVKDLAAWMELAAFLSQAPPPASLPRARADATI